MAAKKKGHKFHRSHFEHHKDSSITAHHMHQDGPQHDVKHAVSGIDGMHDSIEQNLGQPNTGEGMPQAAPASAAPSAPAGIPGVGA